MAVIDNLIHWYDGEDDGGGNSDDSVGSLDLTANGGAGFTTSSTGLGDAYDIPDTGSDYFETAGSNDIAFDSTEDRTFAFRVKRNSGTTNDRIMGIWGASDKNFLITFFTSGQINISLGHGSTTDGSIQATTDISDDAWHSVIITYSGSTDDKFRVYIDGATTPELTSAAFSALTGSSQPFRIGFVDGLPLDGQVDSIAIADSIWGSTEITEYHNSGNGVSYADISGGAVFIPKVRIY